MRRHRARGVVRRFGSAVLPDLPDRRQAARRPQAVPAAQVGENSSCPAASSRCFCSPPVGGGAGWDDVAVNSKRPPSLREDGFDGIARAVVDSAANAIVALGPDRHVTVWNPAAERMFGWTAAEVAGVAPPFVPQELRAEHNAVLERAASGGQVSFATRRACKDGSLIDVRIDAS
ncbi:MAG: PAS domain S-box protein, partial [Actinobacteria bacterium]|nr:PAS domain S-box protein [Actinomycetota bacterium]